ncbi:MAG: hypothetical protein ACLPWF_07800 [Bryobacteraceae bacterium]
MAVLVLYAHETHLAGLRIGEVEPVASERYFGTPHAVVELQRLTIFGVAGALRER